MSNSHAMAVLVADAAAGGGLDVPAEPIITQPEPHPETFRRAMAAGFDDARTDAVVVCYVPPLGVVDERIPRALQEISETSEKTVAACMLGSHGVVGSEQGRAFPSYPTPEDAVRALVTVAHYAERRREPVRRRVNPSGIDRTGARDLVEALLAADPAGRLLLSPGDAAALLAHYGIVAPGAETNEQPAPGLRPRAGYLVTTMEDQLFGPVLSLARTEPASSEPVHRIPPLTETDIAGLISEVNGPAAGASTPGDAVLADVIARVSSLSDDLPEIVDLGLVISVDGHGCTIESASVHLGLQAYRTDSGRRSLTSS